eukprot:2496244-Ditylum_brightwellii.AAC.1
MLVYGKESAVAIFITRVLKRIGFTMRKNSIGQTVPDDWVDQALESKQRIQETFRKEKGDVTYRSGTTMENVKHLQRTNDFKYSTWREGGKGIASVHHQDNH